MKVKAKIECINRYFNKVGDILEVDEEFGKLLIDGDYAELIEEKAAPKKAPAKKPAPKSKAKE